MKSVHYNGKDYRVQDNGLIHVLENNRSGLGWKVLRYTASNYLEMENDIRALVDSKI